MQNLTKLTGTVESFIKKFLIRVGTKSNLKTKSVRKDFPVNLFLKSNE